jgi:UDP-GlcNAc:undecaprenyl-phosphate/decaprenyl-phosphate GlcNAc-1-phosphate transferase
MFAATATAWLAAVAMQRMGFILNVPVDYYQVLTWSMVIAPGVIGGCVEDITHRLRARWRLGLTAFSALLAVGWLQLSVARLGIEPIDTVLAAWPAFGIGLAFVAVMGLPHAFNLIDGYNGLAAMVAIVVCLALAHVALQVGDRELAMMVIALAAATGGFWLWNYPRGLIFAGDSGAYLWGGAIALASLALVQRHGQVSPWFPMLVLIYPVLETLFSIYRKMARGVSPTMADALHFHQLIYRRIVRGVFQGDEARRMLRRNNRTSPYLWGFTLLTVLPAVLFWKSTPVLIAFCALFVAIYVGSYLMIIRFKVPRWLRR